MLLEYLRPNLDFCHIAVLCRLVEAIITVIVLQCRGEEDNEISERIISAKDIPEKVLNNFRDAIATVNRFLKDKSPILSFFKDVEVNLELQVSLLCYRFSVRKAQSWTLATKRQLYLS